MDELHRSVSRPMNKHTNIELLSNYPCQNPNKKNKGNRTWGEKQKVEREEGVYGNTSK